MTGFGRGEATSGGYTAVVELRSVNSRYCEVSTRLPRSLNARDAELQRLVKDRFARGRISLQVQVEDPIADVVPVVVNENAVRQYRRLLQQVAEAAGLDPVISLDQILRFSDILTPVEPEEPSEDAVWTATIAALRLAGDGMRAMRLDEGKALDRELRERLDGIESNLAEIERLAPLRVTATHERLVDRLREFMEDERLDRNRLEFEMAVLADKLDVREECVRLHSHLHLFRQALDSSEPVGRKLNFLSQEMNREVNTIGSKSNDAEMAHLVVGMKEDLEKIREQIENVE
jgi:uncharacterized protein (TIGR00255 family)